MEKAGAGDAGEDSDAALVVRAREGDGDAFGRLVRRYLPAAHGAAHALLGESADADDVCQDAFVAALAHLEECRPEEKFRPWLLTIVRNRALDLRRRQRVRAAEPLEEWTDHRSSDEGRGGGGIGPASGRSPLRDAENADARTHLQAALDTLTDVRREVVLLHDLEGWTHREIATHLGLAEGTVRAHLFWARRRLREALSAEFGDREGPHDTR
ncbi:MAG TPA: RNA polymerase sigma factor [Gemmatimonadaceae bacterium]|nr:RNA polymerase sigma factor [Gemmatimonadaceae bacterium]